MTRDDVARYLEVTAPRASFDVDGIARDVVTTYGSVSPDEIPADVWAEILARHGIRDGEEVTALLVRRDETPQTVIRAVVRADRGGPFLVIRDVVGPDADGGKLREAWAPHDGHFEAGSSFLAARCRVVDPSDPAARELADAYARHVASIPPYPGRVVVKLARRL